MTKEQKTIVFSSITIAILDAVLKYFAIKRLPEDGGRLDSIIGFALHKNPGIAFDIPVPLPLVILLTIGITGLLIYFAKIYWKTNARSSAFSIMIIAGALGNMFDRIINGFTTDYIILFNRSAINLSDVLIILGTILLLSYSEHKESR